MQKTRVVCIIALLAIIICAAGIGIAYEGFPSEGEVYKTLKVDLNKDGKVDKISLRAFGVTESGYFAQMVVKDSSGKTLWEGPKSKDFSSPFTMGGFDFGFSEMEIAGDIDGDGAVELVAPEPMSDVRAPTFKVFRWKGKAFTFVRSKTLMETPAGSGHYPWGDREDPDGRWIAEFTTYNADGTCAVRIFQMSNSGSKEGIAVVAPDSKGFHISRWIQTLRNL